jgi:hypothetical protein
MTLATIEVRALANDARRRLEKLTLTEPAIQLCTDALARMEQILSRPPRVAIMGEVNSGKTSVADLLFGSGVLPASVVTNTHVPILLANSDSFSVVAISQMGRHPLTDDTFDRLPSGLQLQRVEISMPSERLAKFEILDTPGNYVPGDGMPDAQIFVWCTVATRAWTESERAYWSSLPRRFRHNALLVATHKDALATPSDVAKIERRLRTAAAGMFRDTVLVTAAGAARSGVSDPGEPLADESAQALLEHVSTWAAEISARRARKAKRIIQILARLTFHRLLPGPLLPDAAAILDAWEADSGELVATIDGTPASVARVMQALLVRFAHSLSEARSGGVVAGSPVPQPEGGLPARGSYRAAAARRNVGLIAADLTALLRIDLAQWGLQDPDQYADYAAARSALLPLANLDATFHELGQRLAADNAAEPVEAALAAVRQP